MTISFHCVRMKLVHRRNELWIETVNHLVYADVSRWEISTGSSDEMDVDKDFPNITGVKEGLHQIL